MLRMVKRFAAIAVIFLCASSCFAQATPEESKPEEKNDAVADKVAELDKKEKNSKKKKKKGKNDVDSIGCGTRSVGGSGKSLGNWHSLEKEIQIGKQYAAMIEESVRLVRDPVVNEYVNRIGQNLVRNSDACVPFTIKVIDSSEINAFALPGGFFYVNSGLILATDEEAELAGVMAHEIAHVAARHATRQATRSQWANLASLPLIFIGGGVAYGAQTAAGYFLPLAFMKFSRGFEREADELGLQYMYASGYDPGSFVQFFEKLQAREKKKPGSLAKAFSSHPQTPDRIEATKKEIEMVLTPREQYLVTTSEFDDVKARLAAIENLKTVRPGAGEEKKPTLRREKSEGNNKDKDKGENGDEPPVLKRREDERD